MELDSEIRFAEYYLSHLQKKRKEKGVTAFIIKIDSR
jgi:hypothetical protein